jgi:hypothetical protein
VKEKTRSLRYIFLILDFSQDDGLKTLPEVCYPLYFNLFGFFDKGQIQEENIGQGYMHVKER